MRGGEKGMSIYPMIRFAETEAQYNTWWWGEGRGVGHMPGHAAMGYTRLNHTTCNDHGGQSRPA